MANIKSGDLEQIFTPKELTQFLLDLLEEHIDFEITEFLEPSAGNGAMIDVIKERYTQPIISYDIEPKRNDIVEANFLKQKIEYKKGRVTIMNPPFNKGIKFLKKCMEVSDMVISIMSLNSFLNIDYEKIKLKDIYLNKKQKFLDGNDYGICIVVAVKNEENI